jgi:ADP-heptose:LPS heptosyltransferase
MSARNSTFDQARARATQTPIKRAPNRGPLASWLHPEKRLFAASVLLSKLINLGKKTPTSDTALSHILLVRLDEIGDLVTSQPAIALLRKSHPNAHITLWCKPLCKPLMEAVSEVELVVTSEAELKASLESSKVKRIDLWVELRGNWASMRLAALMRPRYRLDRATVRLRNSALPRHPHEVVTNCQVMAPVFDDLHPPYSALRPALFPSAAHQEAAEAFLTQKGIQGPFALLHPTANKPLKRWPASQFAALAKALHARGQRHRTFDNRTGALGSVDNFSS